MKKHIYFSLLACFLTISALQGQSDIKIRVNGGVSVEPGLLSTSYFSFDVGIPVTPYFEFAPTFVSFTDIPHYSATSVSTLDEGISSYGYGRPPGAPGRKGIYGDVVHSVGAVLFYKPLARWENNPEQKNELLIGAGYTYDRYTRSQFNYLIEEDDYTLLSTSTKMVNNFSPIFIKISYNRYFNDHGFFGIVSSLNGFDGDGNMFLGMQIGAKL